MFPLKHKRSIDDIWPLRNKTVLVRADYNVPIKNGRISNDRRIRATLPTIRRIVGAGGRAVIMSHLGRPTGHKYDQLRNDEETSRRYLKVWCDEAGTGKTTFFAICGGEEKKRILARSSVAVRAAGLSVEEGSGKTILFAGLPDEEKKALLDWFQAEERERRSRSGSGDCSGDGGGGGKGSLGQAHHFPQLRQYHGFEEELSLRPIAARLAELLNDGSPSSSSSPSPYIEVKFAEDCMNATTAVASLQPGQVLLLENVRFYSDELSPIESERMNMARRMASYGDYFVTDDFGVSHRDSATVTGIPRVLGHGAAGYLMRREIDAFADVLDQPQRPVVAIVGGTKLSDKLVCLERILQQIDCLIIGGAMAFAFLQTSGHGIGTSFHESGQSFMDKYGESHQRAQRNVLDENAARFLDKARASGVEVVLPLDHVCHTSCEGTDSPLVTTDSNIPDGYMGLDIGPRTIDAFRSCIERSGTAVCNGTMGVYEIPTYATGSFAIMKALADGTEKRGLVSVVGGGASSRVAEMMGCAGRMSHVSSGGSASLDLFEGKVLPGLAALDDA